MKKGIYLCSSSNKEQPFHVSWCIVLALIEAWLFCMAWRKSRRVSCNVGHLLWHMGQSPAQPSGTHTWHTLFLKHSMWNLWVTFTLKGFLVAMLVSLPEVCFCSSCPGPSEKKNCQSSSIKHRLLFHDTVFGKFYVRREWFSMIYLSCRDRMRSESSRFILPKSRDPQGGPYYQLQLAKYRGYNPI